ncbi:cbb3-type cytochrome oxidase subunit 3 [Enterococcus sp. UD-01]|jgi:cbb3-type cytochrome oxidase subunit 3
MWVFNILFLGGFLFNLIYFVISLVKKWKETPITKNSYIYMIGASTFSFSNISYFISSEMEVGKYLARALVLFLIQFILIGVVYILYSSQPNDRKKGFSNDKNEGFNFKWKRI